MDDGEIDFTESNFVNDIPCSASMESFFDELLKNTHACTHTHTCNPPGPDNTHTHTCFHTHTHLFASTEEGNSGDKTENHSAPSPSPGKKRAIGNREAVKKYREKKKAHTAFLEEQVNQLRILNQQLVRRLQGQAALEAEVIRLRTLLSEFRGRIDAELGLSAQRYHAQSDMGVAKGDGSLQPLSGRRFLNTVNVPCDDDIACLHASLGRRKELKEQPGKDTVTSCGACEVVETSNCKRARSDNCGIPGEKTNK